MGLERCLQAGIPVSTAVSATRCVHAFFSWVGWLVGWLVFGRGHTSSANAGWPGQILQVLKQKSHSLLDMDAPTFKVPIPTRRVSALSIGQKISCFSLVCAVAEAAA